ncbi:TonB-linked SusC/RagA family outer membrane protein [Catalinimonas alkaloidigena]|uniref:SusC/RagA family TonB-linked outer membrane protein n=1 Tax=Catalinimonas alkaloidigena TaxID=1075417 RepID=UPI0024055C77|nr:SusC/RagA family TonB-linked outer membrane protein [Catalinimonas alkaloidigena]MDF9799409.1 TonB-linked SusC/RagA family outer membrane protein [Catalinimonas alkaloidigena]
MFTIFQQPDGYWRICLTLLLIGVLPSGTLSASEHLGQAGKSVKDVYTTLKLKNEDVILAFERIENATGFSFTYNLNDVEKKKVSGNYENQSLFNILLDFSRQADLKFRQYNDVINVKPKEKDEKTEDVEVAPAGFMVEGSVIDQKSGEALPGVNVLVKETTIGTVTDIEGKYQIEVPDAESTLIYSSIGYVPQEIAVNGQSVIDVSLATDVTSLEEIVVIGYGTNKKQAITGAVAEADLETFRNVPVNNVLESVKGSVPGLNVGGTNSAGQVAGLSVRGQNSTAASNSPLIVVDGAIFRGSLADIPANDIASLTVLKDASAAAVYGSRSANGVILIETKRGSGINGKPKFEIKVSSGISNQLEPLRVYDADGYIQRLLDIRSLEGMDADPNNISIYLQAEEQKNYEATSDHRPTLEDPYDLISQQGRNLNANFSISNSTEKTDFYISTSLINQQGVVLNDKYKSISGRLNINSDLTDWLNLGINSMYTLRDYSGDSPSMYRATHFSPYASVYNEDGTYKQFPQTTTSFNSPFWEIATEDIDLNNNLNATLRSIIKVPWIEGLTYQTTFSNSIIWNERNWYFNEFTIDGKGKNGIGQREYHRNNYMLFDNLIKYNHTFATKHNVDVTLLYSREQTRWEDLVGYAENFDNTVLGTYKLENGKVQTVETGGGETHAIGLMARTTYTFDEKYSITGTIRRDGYSAFSKNKKWGMFPSLGVNWNISEEDFMNNIEPLDVLSIRASYGTNGNQSISAYSTLAKMGTDKYVFARDPSYAVTQYISTLANNDLGWETTTGLNVGLDFALLGNRIGGSIDAYHTKTSDLMFSLALPRTSGHSSITSNIGEIENKGIELNLHTINISRQNFSWTSGVAFSLNRNKVVTIFGEDNDGDGKEDDLISSGYFIGRPLGTIYNYKVNGMWQEADGETIMEGMRPGDYKLEDVDGDGAITSENDRQFLGNSKENFRWSWTNTFDYKDLSLMVYLYSIWGGDGWYMSGNNTPYHDGYVSAPHINRPVYDYWTPSNTSAMFPRPDYRNAAYKGTMFIDRSFIKLQKISLSYNASRLVEPWGINNLNLAVSADNLLTYAPHWVGLDPETDSGLKDNALPSLRTYMLTLSFNF